MNKMPAYINNRFADNEEAVLHITDLSIQRGYGVFDFCRTINANPLFLQDHLDRFYGSASAMHLDVNKTREELHTIVHELIKRSGLSEAGIRFTLTGGYSADGYTPSEPNLVITCSPARVADEKDFEKGISIITYEYQRELPHIKSINYLVAVWLQPVLKEKHAGDVLYYANNSITEFPRSNVFIVTPENILLTPYRNMLPGITRKNVLSLAPGIIAVEERDINWEELMNAAEVFLTSTTKKILPIVKIDDRIIGHGKPGEFTTALYKKFLALEKSATHLVSR